MGRWTGEQNERKDRPENKDRPAVCQSEKTEYSSLEEPLEPALDELCLMDDVYRKAAAIRLPEDKKKAFSILLHEAIFGQTLKPDKITVSFQTPIPNHADLMTDKNSILDILIQVEGESVSVYDFIQYDIEPGRVLRYSEIGSQFAVRAGKPCNDRSQTNCVFITNANHFKGTRLKIFPHDEPIRIMETVTGDETTCFRFDIHQVFVNARFRDDSFPGHLMQDLNEPDPENITIPLLQDMVKTIKRKKGAEAI
ncbi:hypothetical protein [Faecalibaculum rodentium]|uniref:hypothetical protein n=2 Tax=Faecalibaculum rodentium TaxID=1702221 RepID=UPI002631A1E6|nr:hypothetical protein [Faecalibaculum rodentium]